MSLYFVFTIDGDWNKYFCSGLPAAQRRPDKKKLLGLIRHEIAVASAANGRFLHFVHSSPVTRDFFLQPEFISLWKEIKSRGGCVGVHCHDEHLYRDSRFDDTEKMEKAIQALTEGLSKEGLEPISYRGGYMAFCAQSIPILERKGLFLDFSCDPGRYLRHEGELISDWTGAPDNYYRLSYEDHRKPGKSKVFEIPLGKAGGSSLYIDTTSLIGIWKAAKALAKKSRTEKKDIIVSALSHTYEFSSLLKRIKIKFALVICKRYGTFINDKEVMEIVEKQGR